MTTLLYREPRMLALALLMIAALGAAALNTIGRQEDPTITNIFALAITPFPGASPERVEQLVTEPIEEELRGIPEISIITSTSATGVSVIQIELSEFVPDDRIEQVWSEARDALDDAAASFPPGAGAPDFDDTRIGAFTAIVALQIAPRFEGADDPIGELALLARTAEELEERLRAVPGTQFAQSYGAIEEEIRVEIDPDRIASLGLTAQDVSRAIEAADVRTPAGRIDGGGSGYLVELTGEIDGLDRIREIPLVVEGVTLARVGDVARVFRAAEEPTEEIALHDGARAVLVAARMEPDRQVDVWMAAARAAIADFEAPVSVDIEMVFDQSAYTFDRLALVGANLLAGVLIVVGVLFLTLGWRSAIIVALVLPLASLLSLFVLEQIGVVVHQMSVTGMIVALGLMVDAAIVMTDDIRRRLERGSERIAAVDAAVRRLAAPLLASTVTTVLAFMPMALLPGPAGDFVGSIALSVITMLVVSLLLAVTVTPALAGRILPARSAEAPPVRPNLLARMFRASLRFTLIHRFPIAAAAAAPAIVGFLALPNLTAQFFPGVERDQMYVQVTLPLGSGIEATEDVARRIDDILRAEPDVLSVDWVLGRNAPAFYYNMQADNDLSPEFAEALITTASPEATARIAPQLQAALDAAAPEAQVIVRELVQGPPVAAPLEMRIVGPDLAILSELGERARALMAELPDVTHTRASFTSAAPTLVFDLDEDRVRLAGLTLSDVAAQLQASLVGVEGGALLEGSEESPVRVRIGAEDRSAADRVLDLTIAPPSAGALTADGGFAGVPLSALGDVRLTPSEPDIVRRNGERVNTVQAFLQQGVLPEESLRALQARLADDPEALALPPGYRIEWGGDSDARGDVVRNLISTVGVVVTLTIATIVATFNSWRLSVVAFIVSGLSMGLSLLALAVFDFPFGITALIGVIGSIGVSINAAIIIMSALKDDPRAARGDPDGVVDVVAGASRHIVSTTVTTFGGFLPLILDGGGFWPPFAMAIAGGVLLSTITSLYFVPPVYSLLAGRRGYGARPNADAAVSTAAAAPA